jgi:hypothetical protein
MLAVAAMGPPEARGTSYDPLPRAEEGGAGLAEQGPGATVYLFLGGAEPARRILRVDDVLEVSRAGADGSPLDVGKVRVAAFLGSVCLRAEVIGGKVRVHDLAAKEGVYSLVVPDAVCWR